MAGPRWGSTIPTFDFDNETYSRLAVSTLARRGRKRMLLIPPPRAQSYSRHMITGFIGRRPKTA